MKLDFDCTIVGAGVVGLAIGSYVSQKKRKVLIIERNKTFGEENSSRNSGVIHAGIYYPNNSLKAKLCKIGNKMIYKYAKKKKINYLNCGKFIISQNNSEEKKLLEIKKNAQENGVNLVYLDKKDMGKIEPNIMCHSALLSKSSGIIDVHDFMSNLVIDIEKNNGQIVYNQEVNFIEQLNSKINFMIKKYDQVFTTNYLINSAGLNSHLLARNIVGYNNNLIPKISLIKGNYFKLSGKSPFKKLVYPIPSENGLGIHSTINFNFDTIFGPDTETINKVDFNVNPKLEGKFIKAIKNYWPEINNRKIIPDYSGIRTSLENKDFVIQGKEIHKMKGIINLFGIESPGVTSSLAIGKYIFDKYLDNN